MQRSTYRFRMFLFYQERRLLPRSVVRDTGRDCARSQSTVLPSGSVPQLYRRHQSPSECRRTMHRSRLQRLHHLYESPPTLSVYLIHLQLNIFSHEFHFFKKFTAIFSRVCWSVTNSFLVSFWCIHLSELHSPNGVCLFYYADGTKLCYL